VRRALKVVMVVVVVLIALPLMAIAAALVSFNTPPGRAVIEIATKWLTHDIVRLSGLAGRFPDRLRLARLSITDPQGTWLVADGVAVEWSPVQLLHGRVQIEHATAARIAVLRRPAYAVHHSASPPAPRSQRPLGSLPLTIELDRVDFPRIDLYPVLAGSTVALRLQGQGRYRSLEQAALQFSAQRLDTVPSTYAVTLESNAARVQGHLELDENANGPLANLLRLPGLGALAVHLDLLGPPDALGATLDASAGPLRAQARGTLDLPGVAANLDLTLQSPAMTPRAGLSWQSAVLQAHAQGALMAPASRAHLQVAGLYVGGVQSSLLQVDLQGEGRALALDGTLTGLNLPAPIASLFAHAPIKLQGHARLVSASGMDFDLSLSHPLLQAQAHYQLGVPGPSMHASQPARHAGAAVSTTTRNGGSLVATVPQLGPWAALAHLDLQGRGSIQADLSVLPQASQLTLSAGLDLRDGDPRWIHLLGPRVQFAAGMQFTQDNVQFERVQLSGAALQASAHGEDREQRLNIAWQLALSDLSRLSPTASGQLAAQGQVQGVAPHLKVAVDANTTFSQARTRGALHLALQADDLPQRPSGRLDVSGSLNNAALVLAANLRANMSTRAAAFELERADWKSVHAAGALQIDGDQLAPQGQLSLRLGRLQDLSTLFGEQLEGSVDAGITFERAGEQNRARVSLQGRDVVFGTARLPTLQLSGDIDAPLRQPRVALRLSSDAVVHGLSATLSAQADGPLDALDLSARATAEPSAEPGVATEQATGAGGAPATPAATGATATLRGIWNQGQSELQLKQLEADYRGQNMRLLGPARISFHQGIVVDRLRLQLPPAVLQLQGRLSPQLDVHASLRNFDPGTFGVVMPLVQAKGHTDIDVELHGELSQPTGRLTLTAGGLAAVSGAARGLPPATLRVTAQLARGTADVNAALTAGTHMQLRATGSVPLQRSGVIAVKLVGNAQLDVLNPVLEAGGQRMLGELSVQAQVSGTPAAPQARGSLSIQHGDLQDYPRGVHISDLTVALDAEGSQLQLKQFSATAGPGTLSASGSLNLSAAGMPVQLELQAHNAEPLKTDLITANLDADLRVTGALLRRELAAAGTLRINRATINIPNALPPDVATLQVVRPGQAPPPPPPKPLVARMDLTINAPRGIYVRGRGLNAEVGGTLRIGGTGAAPAIGGGFDLINGTMDLAGATLTFASGRISFNGTGLRHRIDPTLQFEADSAIGGNTAKLLITGYADAPVITLTSTPNPEPQDQILAQLLFGQNVSQLSALQAAGIASALVSLSGAGGGGSFNPLNTVQQRLGLNRLVISGGTPTSTTTTGQTNSGVTIQAGRYVSSRVYVGAKQSTNGLTQAQVQVDLTRQLKLQTTLSTGGGTVQGATPQNDPGSSVGVSYQFQY
jgi:translocation and assembly module TamB